VPARRTAAALAAIATVVTVGCGGGEGDVGGLVWTRAPRVFRAPDLPRDRILTGIVRNDSLRTIAVEARDVRVVDAGGDELRSDTTFVRGYLHGLYPPMRPPPGGLPEAERLRVGHAVKLRPGEATRLSVAWRLPNAAARAARIEWGAGSLAVPGR
jgi:hypothetical protein